MSKVAAAALAALVVAGPYAAAENKQQANRNQAGIKAAVNSEGRNAREFIGQDVLDRSGNRLGELNDLVVDTKSGKVVFATIGSGGVLGIGERVRAVPFLRLSQRPDNELQLDIDAAKWSNAPQFDRRELSTLTDQRGREIFDHYGADWKKMSGKAMGQMAFATELEGKDLVNGTQDVGEIDAVVVNLGNQRASLLIDADNDFAGSSENFVVSMDKVSTSAGDRDKLNTKLTRADFERATPADRNYWDNTSGDYVYRWSAFVYPHPSVATAVSVTDGQMHRGSVDRNEPVSMIKEALRNDASLKRAADRVDVVREGDNLVLRGTVSSEDMKDRIEDKAEALSRGMDIENRLQIATGE